MDSPPGREARTAVICTNRLGTLRHPLLALGKSTPGPPEGDVPGPPAGEVPPTVGGRLNPGPTAVDLPWIAGPRSPIRMAVYDAIAPFGNVENARRSIDRCPDGAHWVHDVCGAHFTGLGAAVAQPAISHSLVYA